MDRQTVIKTINKAIEERMPAHRMEVCHEFARQYGQKYGISNLIEDWINDGRNVTSPEEALEWLESLP